MDLRIQLVQGDITEMEVDAIVNAANASLLGGGGVDGAIHRAAGPDLLKECKSLKGCRTGDAKITSGYNLKARYVIHTVGPVWKGGIYNEEDDLAGCYRNSLLIARKYKCKSVCFPNISTGVYRFPKNLAADIAVREVKIALDGDSFFEKIVFVCFDDENYSLYFSLLS